MAGLHQEARDEFAPVLASDPDLIGVDGVAEIYGVTPHSVIADLVPRGRARVIRRVRVGVEGERLLFSRTETEDLRRRWLQSNDHRARLWLDPRVAVNHARGSGRIDAAATALGITLEQAEALEHARALKRRKALLPKGAGAKPKGLSDRWAEMFLVTRHELEESGSAISTSTSPTTGRSATGASPSVSPTRMRLSIQGIGAITWLKARRRRSSSIPLSNGRRQSGFRSRSGGKTPAKRPDNPHPRILTRDGGSGLLP
jgi:hypothetical protein